MGKGWEAAGRGRRQAGKRLIMVLVGEDGPGQTAVTSRGRRVRWVETDIGKRNPNLYDTMLGIDKLYSIKSKGHNI
jgi:hypothetical protein